MSTACQALSSKCVFLLIFFAHGAHSNVVFRTRMLVLRAASVQDDTKPLSSHWPSIIQPASTSEQRSQNELLSNQTLSIRQLQQLCRERKIKGKCAMAHCPCHPPSDAPSSALPCHPHALIHHPAFRFSNAPANHPMHPADL
ncbi:hypothetical protein M405DRAFT_834366 [Rhizopogon salebrosus TDB-379]|nr:hypothetical protein M405DRAFT_834366 [Rhizopogon salebrosus TDB-379]